VAAKTNTTSPPSQETLAKRAYTAMAEIRSTCYRRLVDYVLTHERRLRDEVNGEDSYSHSLQQMDEMFLNKLGIIERAVAELSRCEQRDGQLTAMTYETIEVLARREELPQKIAEVLAEHGDSDFLDLCVLRADEKQAEVLLVLAREDSVPPPSGPQSEQRSSGGASEDQAGNSGNFGT
jgi:hypothetical protein